MADPAANAKNLLLPTSNKMPALMTPAKLGSDSGSATGNPRNKCALKPGHSLMHWIRLGSSGEDLAGTRGRVKAVSSDELAQHNTREDAWLVIRGKVYNVTRYMDFHPGGVDELMRGVGRDATKLFDEVHAWVNYQQLLAKCYVGPLRPVATRLSSIDEAKSGPVLDAVGAFAKPPIPTVGVVPRFDWIQKGSELGVFIYTRKLCNPGLLLRRKSGRELQLWVQIEQLQHLFEFELQHSVNWPPKAVHVGSETGKIEITLSKTNTELWSNYGAHTATTAQPTLDDELQYECEIVARHNFNHNSFEMSLKGAQDTIMLPPIGSHVALAALVNGELVRRSYTPVNAKYLHTPTASNGLHLNFLIKSYASSLLASYMLQQELGAGLLLSAPRYGIRLHRLLEHRRITLIAAGSGLTPFLNLIEHLLQRSTNRLDHLCLMYFNKTEADIWCRGTLEHLQSTDERFRFINVLSQATDDWAGMKGHICADLLAPLLASSAPESGTFVAVCGPNEFNQQVNEILSELKFNLHNLHIFQE